LRVERRFGRSFDRARHAACEAPIPTVTPLGRYPSAIAIMKRFTSAIVLALAVGYAAASSTPAFAEALDEPLHCDRSAHDFIGALESQGLIDPHPSHVEPNSINAFNPAHAVDLTAFGFRVFAIVGYQKDDPMFEKGDGKPLADSAYGAVVLGSTASVATAAKAAGSSAIIHHVGPFITAIFCQIDTATPTDHR
jgi:hypothetical protein